MVTNAGPREVLRMFLWNMAMGWFVLTPLIWANEADAFARQGRWHQGPVVAVVDLSMFCLVMGPTTAVGTLAHSLALLAYWVLARGRWLPFGTIALAPLAPLTVWALQLSGFRFFEPPDMGLVIGVGVYALTASAQWRGRSTTGASPDS